MKLGLFWKTVIVTIGVIVILAFSVFGIASLLAPAAMMRFTEGLGLKSISGDYAYQEYERSGDLTYLTRSFVISAELGNDRTAESRFSTLYGAEDFSAFCTEQGDVVLKNSAGEELGRTPYRVYLCGLAASVRYRLAGDAEARDALIAFAAQETDHAFSPSNAFVALTAAAASGKDVAFCTLLKSALEGGSFDTENKDYCNIIKILEDVIHE